MKQKSYKTSCAGHKSTKVALTNTPKTEKNTIRET